MTGSSLPGDLQRLLGACRAAGARSPSAGISNARSGRGPDGRLRGSGSSSDAPPAPGPRPGPASRAPARAPRLRAVQAARPRVEGGGPPALSAPGGSAPRTPSAPRPGSLPSSPGGQPHPPFSRRSLSVPSSALPRPRLRWRGPGLPPQAKAADALSPSPARRDTSPMLSLSLKHREKKHPPRRNACLQPVRNCLRTRHRHRPLPAQGQAGREGTRRPAPAFPGLRRPGVLTQRDLPSTFPREAAVLGGWRGQEGTAPARAALPELESVPR